MKITKVENLRTISSDSVNYTAESSDFAKNFLFYLISTGHFRTSKNYYTNRYDNDFSSFLLLYIIKGKIRLHVDKNSYTALENQILMVDCYHKHHYEALCESEFYYIHFDGSNSRDFAEEILRNKSPVFTTPYFDKQVAVIKRIISSLSGENMPDESWVSVDIHTILVELCKDLTSNYKIKYSKYVQHSVQYIHNNYMNRIKIDDISKAIGLSPQHLNRLFKNETGTSPYRYLLSYRMSYSIKLLIYTDYNIDEISFLIGFSSGFNYMNAFKKLHKVTPSEYRKLHKSY